MRETSCGFSLGGTLGRLEKTVFGRSFEATHKTAKKGDGERTRRHPLCFKFGNYSTP